MALTPGEMLPAMPSGEGDLKNCQAMKIMDLLGIGGSYTEFYGMDFDEDFPRWLIWRMKRDL